MKISYNLRQVTSKKIANALALCVGVKRNSPFTHMQSLKKLTLNVTLNRSIIIHLQYIFQSSVIFYSDRIFLQCWPFTLDKERVIQVSSKLKII